MKTATPKLKAALAALALLVMLASVAVLNPRFNRPPASALRSPQHLCPPAC